MDLNIKLIEAVRQYPSLYNTNDNLEERNRAWKQLSDRLKMQEIFLKIRWHSLLQGYRRDAKFKYGKRMQFVQPNIKSQVKEEYWPEFIITEDDLKDDKHSAEQDDIVFVEIDEEGKIINEIEPITGKQIESGFKESALQTIVDKTIDGNKDKEETTCESRNICKNNETLPKPLVTEIKEVKETVNQTSERTPDPISTSLRVEEKPPVVDESRKHEPCIIESKKEVVTEKPQPLTTERCEDVIFGELVSAMLKRMDETKKKHIKKEIMNLLFS